MEMVDGLYEGDEVHTVGVVFVVFHFHAADDGHCLQGFYHLIGGSGSRLRCGNNLGQTVVLGTAGEQGARKGHACQQMFWPGIWSMQNISTGFAF